MPLLPRRLIALPVLLLVLFFGSAAFAADDNERESPPERKTLEELNSLAQAAGLRAPRPATGRRIASTSLTWSPLGPGPIDYDYWSTGPASGRVSAIAVDPRDGDIAYVAAAQGGVWKTTDGGSSWMPLTDGLSSLASGALALHPADPEIVIYATGEQHFSGDSFYGDGAFRSLDGGATWAQIAGRGEVGSYVARVAYHATRPETLYLASSAGFVRSLNGGSSWTVTLSPNWSSDLVVDPERPDTVYTAILSSGIYRSFDAGATWTHLGGGLPAGGFDRVNLAISRSNPQVLYASFVNLAGGLLGLYRTTDGGATWALLPATPDYLGGQGWYDNCLAVDPTDANVCFAGGMYPYDPSRRGVIRTLDGGASWTDVTFGIDGLAVHPDEHMLTFGPDGRLWLGNDGGVWRTSDGGAHWTNCNDGLGITQFYAIDIHPENGDRILGGTQDNGTVIFEGAPVWPQVIAGDGGYCLFLWNDPASFFTTYVQLNPVYRWHETFGFQAEITGPWGEEDDRASFALGPLVQDRNTPNTLLAGTYRVWRTNDLGATWDVLSGDLTGGGSVLRALTVTPGEPNSIWAGSFDGRVFVTTDGGTWDERDAGLPGGAVNDIWVDPVDPLTAYLSTDVATGGRVWRTDDRGLSWTSVTGDLPVALRGLCLTVDWNAGPPRLYLGTDYGVYRSSDGGSSWEKEDAGLPSVAVFDLEIRPAGELVAGTHGRGMWRGVPSPTAVAGPRAADGEIALTAVTPTRPPAALDYRMPVAGEVTIEIYDVTGRRLRTLERSARPAGTHRAWWDGRDERGASAGDGVYWARLRIGAGERVAKLTLFR